MTCITAGPCVNGMSQSASAALTQNGAEIFWQLPTDADKPAMLSSRTIRYLLTRDYYSVLLTNGVIGGAVMSGPAPLTIFKRNKMEYRGSVQMCAREWKAPEEQR